MILFKSNASQVAEALRQIAREYPREFPRVLATVGLGLRGKVRAAIPNGVPPLRFSPWNSFTRKMKALRLNAYRKKDARREVLGSVKRKKSGGLTASGRAKLRQARQFVTGFGGKLTAAVIYKKTSKPSAYIGFPNDKLATYAKKFQSQDVRSLTKKERAFRHRIEGETLSATIYSRPARKIFEAFAADPSTQSYIIDVAKKRLQSIITKEANKVKA